MGKHLDGRKRSLQYQSFPRRGRLGGLCPRELDIRTGKDFCLRRVRRHSVVGVYRLSEFSIEQYKNRQGDGCGRHGEQCLCPGQLVRWLDCAEHPQERWPLPLLFQFQQRRLRGQSPGFHGCHRDFSRRPGLLPDQRRGGDDASGQDGQPGHEQRHLGQICMVRLPRFVAGELGRLLQFHPGRDLRSERPYDRSEYGRFLRPGNHQERIGQRDGQPDGCLLFRGG